MFYVFCFTSHSVYAGVTVIQPLSFGAFVVKRNDAQYDITIDDGGTYSYSSVAFNMITAPEPGIFDFDGLPALTPVVSITITELTPISGSGDNFNMLDFTTSHNPSTDASGVLRVNIGATARSSGSGMAYPDQTMNGQLEVTINF